MKKIIFVFLSLFFVKQSFGASQTLSPEPQAFDLGQLAEYCIKAEDPEQFFNEISRDLSPRAKFEFETAIRNEANKKLNLAEDLTGARKIDTMPIPEILNKFKKICMNVKGAPLNGLIQDMQNIMGITFEVDKSIDDTKILISFNVKHTIDELWLFFTAILDRYGFEVKCISEKRYLISKQA